jgi:hypothetical protein
VGVIGVITLFEAWVDGLAGRQTTLARRHEKRPRPASTPRSRGSTKHALEAFLRTLGGYTLADLLVRRRKPLAQLFAAS